MRCIHNCDSMGLVGLGFAENIHVQDASRSCGADGRHWAKKKRPDHPSKWCHMIYAHSQIPIQKLFVIPMQS